MKNIELIYKNLKECKVNRKRSPIVINIQEDVFNSNSLVFIASRFKYLLKYRYLPYSVAINFKSINFADKITYLILDTLLYDLFKRTNFTVCIQVEGEVGDRIHNAGFEGTAMFNSVISGGDIDKKAFIKFYEKGIVVNNSIYRRFLTRETLKNIQTPSIIYSEVATILKTYSDDEDWNDSISEVISELICNASSHADGDCLLHINFNKCADENIEKSDEKERLINIAVINFSNNRLFDKIKENLEKKKYIESDLLYNRIYKAYSKHSNYFNEYYKSEHFFLITAFQNHVSTRSYSSGTSGTGLTALIQNIIGKTKSEYTYVLSGNNILFFQPKYLKMSPDKFIGFNEENDYFNYSPANEVIGKTNLYIPGTIYQLLLSRDGN